MFYKNACSFAALAFSVLLLSGCAQTIETINSFASETPPDAPPGYHSFVMGQKAERSNDIKGAVLNYCSAADLGHPEAKPKCIRFAYLNALEDPVSVCQARDFDEEADRLCSLAANARTRIKAREEIRIVVERMEEPRRKAAERKKMQERINNGEFPEFKVEEF